MRREPDLTFEGALRVLGRYEPEWIKRLNAVLDGVILAAGAGLATAALGPATLAPLAKFGLVWGWVEQKGVAVGLLEKAVTAVSERLAGARGRERRGLIIVAHTTIVAAAVFEVFREHVGTQFYKQLKITDEEKKGLFRTTLSQSHTDVFECLYAAEVPAPCASHGFEENLPRVEEWQSSFIGFLEIFIRGLAVGEKARINWTTVLEKASERYRSHYLRLAATVPEFAIWANLGEHAATRTAIADLRADVAAALAVEGDALSRIEALLSLTAPDGGQLSPGSLAGVAPDPAAAMPNLLAAVARGNAGILDETVVPADPQSYGLDITLPTVREIYVNPQYRVAAHNEHARPADEQWWADRPVHDDFEVMLAAYATSPDAMRLPMLLLGHPGAGKSLLTKIFAVRLPAADYTVVRVPLRRVGASAPVIDQIQQALDRVTNRRVNWWQLADQGEDTVRVVLLDGLDELLQASRHDQTGYLQEVADFQRRQAEQDRPVAVVVTSRTVVADRVVIPQGATIVKLDPFTDANIADWRDRWNRINAVAISSGKMRPLALDVVRVQPELARQPLLLLMLALYVANPALEPLDDIGLTIAELYRRLLTGFARREAAKELVRDPSGSSPPVGGLRPDELEERARDHLERLAVAALGMFNRGRQDIGEEELGTDLAALDLRLVERTRPAETGQRIIGEFFFVHAPQALPLTGAGVGMASGRGTGEVSLRAYEFLHATFGEYLVARQVMDELFDAAEKAFAGRRGRGPADPDDDRLYALLSHQALAARRSMLDFAREICTDTSARERGQVLELLELLLGTYRNRHGSDKYTAYRPVPQDQVRQLAYYSANLTVLRVTLEPGVSVPLSKLLRESDQPLERWRSMVMLWRSGLDADGLHAMLATVNMPSNSYALNASTTNDEQRGNIIEPFPAATEVSVARLIGDRPMELRLRYGAAITEAYIYYNSEDDWLDMMASWLIPQLAQRNAGWAIADPPPDIPHADVIEVARLIFKKLRSGAANASLDKQLIQLLFRLPRVFELDELALATAVLNNPGLRNEIPQLKKLRIFGKYADIVNRSASDRTQIQASFKNLPRGAMAAIREIIIGDSTVRNFDNE